MLDLLARILIVGMHCFHYHITHVFTDCQLYFFGIEEVLSFTVLHFLNKLKESSVRTGLFWGLFLFLQVRPFLSWLTAKEAHQNS